MAIDRKLKFRPTVELVAYIIFGFDYMKFLFLVKRDYFVLQFFSLEEGGCVYDFGFRLYENYGREKTLFFYAIMF